MLFFSLLSLYVNTVNKSTKYNYILVCAICQANLFPNDEKSRRFSLLYKLFSYHRYNEDVKIEFFPFVKIMQTSAGDSWSFCWRLLEKHDGGGHIFFIPWGDPAPEYGKIDD